MSNAKLTDAQREQIARRYLAGEKQADLAREYGVTSNQRGDTAERQAIAAERMAAAQEDQARALWCRAQFDHARLVIELVRSEITFDDAALLEVAVDEVRRAMRGMFTPPAAVAEALAAAERREGADASS